MTVEETRFITEMPQGMRSGLRDLRKEQLNQGLRMTAVGHRLFGIDTHLVALQHGVDSVKTDMRRVKQRLELVEE